jgi:hypothetical protein
MALLLSLSREAEGRRVEASTLSLYSLQVKHYRQPPSHIPPHLSLHCAIFHLLLLNLVKGEDRCPLGTSPPPLYKRRLLAPPTLARGEKDNAILTNGLDRRDQALKSTVLHSCLRMKGS